MENQFLLSWLIGKEIFPPLKPEFVHPDVCQISRLHFADSRAPAYPVHLVPYDHLERRGLLLHKSSE